MWTVLAFISALCLGFYDVSKKIALRENRVIDVLTISICVSALFLAIPLVLSRMFPQMMEGTHFYVPRMDGTAHAYTLLKSVIVLSSWVFGYISLKHLPISVVSPMQATRPMWTLVGALLIFHEHLNSWQWVGIVLAIGSIFVFSVFSRRTSKTSRTSETSYYICLALAILLGACSGLYDKYLMRRYDHNAVQVYYTFYQAVMMLVTWAIMNRKDFKFKILDLRFIKHIGVIVLISLFLIISDNVYMLALRDPDSMIAVVSTIRRGGAVIGFGYGLLFLKETDPTHKIMCMVGILAGLICLAMGSL